MKAIVLGLALAGLAVVTSDTQEPVSPPDRVTSPEIHADRHVTFRIMAPHADEVQLSGEFLEEAVALDRDATGVWSTTVGPVEPEIYEYEFRVDSVPLPDIGNPAVKYNSTPGVVSSLLDVPAERPRFYDARPIPHGSVAVRWYESTSVQTTRRLHVYTPPAEYQAGRLFLGGRPASPDPDAPNVPSIRRGPMNTWTEAMGTGAVLAIDLASGEQRWKFKMTDVTSSGILTTASDLLFTGSSDGDFQALDARTGALLWRATLGGQIANGPMTYAVDDTQYVAVAAGNALFVFGLRE